jgi:phosphorylcholine metabolism protein LicD
MYQYENHKNEKGLKGKLEVIYPKRTVLSLVIRHLITYYIQKSGLADQKKKKYSIPGDDGILVKILTNYFYLNL